MVCNLYEIDTLRSVVNLIAARRLQIQKHLRQLHLIRFVDSLRSLTPVELSPAHLGGIAGLWVPPMEQGGIVHPYDLHGGVFQISLVQEHIFHAPVL